MTLRKINSPKAAPAAVKTGSELDLKHELVDGLGPVLHGAHQRALQVVFERARWAVGHGHADHFGGSAYFQQ